MSSHQTIRANTTRCRWLVPRLIIIVHCLALFFWNSKTSWIGLTPILYSSQTSKTPRRQSRRTVHTHSHRLQISSFSTFIVGQMLLYYIYNYPSWSLNQCIFHDYDNKSHPDNMFQVPTFSDIFTWYYSLKFIIFFKIQVNTAADYREPSRLQYDLFRKNKLPGSTRRHMLKTLSTCCCNE